MVERIDRSESTIIQMFNQSNKSSEQLRVPEFPGVNSISHWVSVDQNEREQAFSTPQLSKLIQSKQRVRYGAVWVHGTSKDLAGQWVHTINFEDIVVTLPDGSEMTCGIDQANMIMIEGYRPLTIFYRPTELPTEMDYQEFKRKALSREIVYPLNLKILQRYHDYCCKKMHLRCLTPVTLEDWGGQG